MVFPDVSSLCIQPGDLWKDNVFFCCCFSLIELCKAGKSWHLKESDKENNVGWKSSAQVALGLSKILFRVVKMLNYPDQLGGRVSPAL